MTVAAVGLCGCGGTPEPLVVKQFMLRDQKQDTKDEPMVGMEKSRRLRGAVSMEERRQRLGQYYTLVWNDADGMGQGEVKVRFRYRQGATASRVKQMERSFGAGERSGVAEFAVIGDDYFENGRVLAWQAVVTRGGREIAREKSYLWD